LAVIRDLRTLDSHEIGKLGWNGLRRHRNVEALTDALVRHHSIDPHLRHFAKKQATQISFSLEQAREYYDSSLSVTLVTKPVLLYYSCMCLAIAQFLFLGDGNVSLDRARSEHRHHGLVFHNYLSKPTGKLISAAANLVAKPATKGEGVRYGTFDLWHRHARSTPAIGKYTRRSNSGGSTSGPRVLGMPRDERMKLLNADGVNLLELLKMVPGMSLPLLSHKIRTNQTRGRLEATQNGDDYSLVFTMHPGDNEVIDRVAEKFKIEPQRIPDADAGLLQMESGFIFTLKSNKEINLPNISVPDCVSLSENNSIFWLDDIGLNEFGILYVCLYIIGNYARYYPDFWIHDVNNNTELAVITQDLIEIAEQRLPILTLGELDRAFYIPHH
jgi:hypothetical protein